MNQPLDFVAHDLDLMMPGSQLMLTGGSVPIQGGMYNTMAPGGMNPMMPGPYGSQPGGPYGSTFGKPFWFIIYPFEHFKLDFLFLNLLKFIKNLKFRA